MAWVWRSFDPLEMRKKSVKPASTASSSRIRVSSAFLSSQASAAAKTMRRVSVVAIRSGRISLVSMVSLPAGRGRGSECIPQPRGRARFAAPTPSARAARISVAEMSWSRSGSRNRLELWPEGPERVKRVNPASRCSPVFSTPLGKRRIDLFQREAGPAGHDKVAKKQ